MDIRLRPWASEDLPLLRRGNSIKMTAYLAGPETDEQIQARHEKYLRLWRDGEARMFVILADNVAVGAIGWWSTQWNDEDVHETGWFVVPEWQGKGIARSALSLIIEDARAHRTAKLLTAFPSEENTASNALCASCGFTMRATNRQLPFRGQVLSTNVWAIDLSL